MAPTSPKASGAASKPAPGVASGSTGDLKDLQPRAELCVARDSSAELGYGCVDWFIYVTDAADAPNMMHLAAS